MTSLGYRQSEILSRYPSMNLGEYPLTNLGKYPLTNLGQNTLSNAPSLDKPLNIGIYPSFQPKSMGPPVDSYTLRFLISGIMEDLQSQQYISAAAIARRVLRLSVTNPVPEQIINLCKNVLTVMNSMGFTEENELYTIGKEAREKEPCPDFATLSETGECPEGFVELSDIPKRKGRSKCCIKMEDDIRRADKDNMKILNDLNVQDANLKRQFEERFALPGTPAEKEKETGIKMLNKIPDTMKHVIERGIIEQGEKLEVSLNYAMEQQQKGTTKQGEEPWILLGMTKELFSYLLEKFQSVSSLVKYMVFHDWTHYTMAIYLVRWIMMIVCFLYSMDKTKGLWAALTAAGGFSVTAVLMLAVTTYFSGAIVQIVFSVLWRIFDSVNFVGLIFGPLQSFSFGLLQHSFLQKQIFLWVNNFAFFGEVTSIALQVGKSVVKSVNEGRSFFDVFCNEEFFNWFTFMSGLFARASAMFFSGVCYFFGSIAFFGPEVCAFISEALLRIVNAAKIKLSYNRLNSATTNNNPTELFAGDVASVFWDVWKQGGDLWKKYTGNYSTAVTIYKP